MKSAGFSGLCLAFLLVATGACGDETTEEPTGNRNNCVGSCNTNNGEPDEFGPKDPGDWTSFRNGPLRTGFGEGSVVGSQYEVLWKKDSFLITDYGAAKPSPAVWGNQLFYPTDEGEMVAFDRTNGQELWRVRLIDGSNGIHSSPQATNSIVLIGTYRGNLHALDRMTGMEIWSYKIGNVIGSSPVYVHEHAAIYTSHETPQEDPYPGGGYVTKNDPWTGEAIWVSDKLRHWPHSSVAVDPERNVVVVGANDGIFHGYDTDDGTELWQFDLEPGEEYDPPTGDIKTTPAISASRGLMVAGSWDSHVYALDVTTGEEAWRFDTGGRIMGSAAIDDNAGRVYVGSLSPSNRMFAVDLDSGEEIWSFDAGGGVMSSPAISGDGSVVVFGAHSANVFAVDTTTGEEIWRFGTDGSVTASPALVDDMIYIAAKNGSLYAIRTF